MTDFSNKPLIYHEDGMSEALVQRDIAYNDAGMTMDIYTPSDSSSANPAVLLVHGDVSPKELPGVKNWQIHEEWARLLTVRSFTTVVFNHRSSQKFSEEPAFYTDIEDAVTFVRENAVDFNIDVDNLSMFGISIGVPYTLTTVQKNQWDFVKCVVAYYGYMDLTHLPDQFDKLTVSVDKLREISPFAFVDCSIPPTLLVRAGKDRPFLNVTTIPFITAALEHNHPIELINHPGGEHCFDMGEPTAEGQRVIQRTLSFLETHTR